MTQILYRSRSCRARIQVPGDEIESAGQGIQVDNLDGTGLRMTFNVRKSLTAGPDEGTLSIFNLGPDQIGRIETQRGHPGSLLDLTTYGDNTSWATPRPQVPTSALDDGLSLVTVEAGYDGALSTVWEATTAMVKSRKEGNVTNVTTVTGYDNLDGFIFAGSNTVYLKGAPIYQVVVDLVAATGMVRGNLDEVTWSSLVGPSATLTANYTVSGDPYKILNAVFEYLRTSDNVANIRWFQTNGEFFIYRDDSFVPGAPIELPPIKTRPQRDDSGMIVVTTYLAPLVTPGRLVLLTPEATSSAQLGGLGSVAQIQRADIPPGTYRCDRVDHTGDTHAAGMYSSRMSLWPASFGGAA